MAKRSDSMISVGVDLTKKQCIFTESLSKFMSKRTYQPSQQKRMTTHGFLARKNSAKGSNVLQARRRKGRASLAVKPSK